ncbi:MAG: hypothetical protein CMI23_03960 [Opitutae bacterium]|nr:hypothetical protein [Opitutae bacterium]
MLNLFLENKKNSYLFVTIVALIFLLPGTFQLPLLDRDEPRFSRATVEMRENSNWIVPFFNGEFRFDKPPLTYWWMGINHWIFGVNEFSCRLHSIISTWLIALWVCVRGTRWVGRKAAFVGSIGWLLNLQVWQHGRLALADMPMVLCVCFAMDGLWSSINKDVSKKERSLGFFLLWLGLAVGFLAKGPIVLAIPLCTFLLYFALRRQATVVKMKLIHLAGLLISLGIVAMWGVPALIQTNGLFAREGLGTHVVERGLGAFNNRSYSPLFYFFSIFLSFFPWWLQGFGKFQYFKKLWKDNQFIFLFIWVLVPFLIFSFYSTQLPHYLLPGFPALFLITGKIIEKHWLDKKRALPILEVILTLVVLFFYFTYDYYADPDFPSSFVPWVGLILVSFIWIPYLLITKNFFLFAAWIINLAFCTTNLASKIRHEHLTLKIMEAGNINPKDEIFRYSKSFAEPSLVYYLGGPWTFGVDANLSLPVFQVERFDNREPTKNGLLVEGFNPARGKKEKVWIYPANSN